MAAKQRRANKLTRRNFKRKPAPRKSLPLGGFPKSHLVKLRYIQEIVLTTTGLSVSVPLHTNGLFDPYYPIGGHQPKGFDQWMAVYNHYNVLGSKCNVKLASTNGADNFAWGVCTTPTHGQMSGKTLEYVLENRYQKGYRLTGSNYNHSGLRSRVNATQTARYSQKAQFGKNATSKKELTGNNAANPTEGCMFEIWQCPINNISSSLVGSYIVSVDYLVLLTEPRVLLQS